MKKRVLLFVACVSFTVALAHGQYDPTTGAEDLYDLYSPTLLGGNAAFGMGEGPQADALNPATSATLQRTTIDASYLSLAALGSPGNTSLGHVINLGMLLPTRVGVFGGSVHFVSSPFETLPLGTSFLLHLTAAKELYPGWSAGVGVRASAGASDQFDFGVAADLGVVRDAGPNALVPGLQWGVAIQNVGKWYSPVADGGPIPAPFTPSLGASFLPVDGEWFDWKVGATLRSPGFQNLAVDVGTELSFFDTVTMRGGWQIDLLQMARDDIEARSLIPSFGVSVSFTAGLGEEGFAAEQGWTETRIQTSAAATPLYNDIWAIGGGVNAPLGVIDTEGPRVSIRYPEEIAFSPNNDGIADALEVPIQIRDDRFVVGWTFLVRDANGNVVRTIENVDDRPENTGLQNFVDRVTSVRSGVPIPEQIRWDGRTDEGSQAPDGEYSFDLAAVDDNGNQGSSARFSVVLDSMAPEIAVEPLSSDQLIFSPNDDGNKDSLTIEQNGSAELLWSAAVLGRDGEPIRTFVFENGPPQDVEWDGRDNEGILQPDGVYRYRIASTDRAGNTTMTEVPNIIIDTEPTPIALTISTSHFSPDGDGTKDVVRITPDVPVTNGLTQWEIIIFDSALNPVRRYGGNASNPEPVDFDGRGEAGTQLPEGRYEAEVRVLYRNGNQPVARTAEFVLDVTDPIATTRADVDLFSPNGDDVLDSVTFVQEASEEEQWTGTVVDAGGTVVRSFTWSGTPESRLTWEGRQDNGRLAPDGVYRYTLTSTDRAGNTGSSGTIAIELDTGGADLALQAVFDAFSPNSDGTLDRQEFDLRTDRPEDVVRMVLQVQNSGGQTVWQSESDRFRNTVTWDGRSTEGRPLPDGRYSANTEITLANGNMNSASTATFLMDSTQPELTLSTEYLLFSPDGDGNRDVIRIEQTGSEEEAWEATITAANGDLIREYTFRGSPVDVAWDGTDTAGNSAPDGVYSYQIETTDRAGNSTSAQVQEIRIDTRQPRLFVTADTSGISPNGDGIREEVSFELYANVLDGADGWRLEITNSSGSVIREFSGQDILQQETVVWNGRDSGGDVQEGAFTAVYAIDYTKGNQPRATSSEVIVDTTAPQVDIDLAPIPFSPDNDGVDDELMIRFDIEDESDIQAWRFEILDRNDRFFNEFTGRGMPASRLIWDGRASDGELVISAEDYPYEFVIGDELGNVTRTSGTIPVDILVVRDGDRLKVQITNITFEPDSPNLVLDPDSELGQKNLAIINRLGEVFDKYSSYSIRIEGHAVNITGTEREEREQLEPLSLSRAETVRDALIEQGIAARRITTLGRGGTEPIVPHDDLENRWKNRRVEFILIR